MEIENSILELDPLDIVFSSSSSDSDSDSDEPKNKKRAVRPYLLNRKETGAMTVVVSELARIDLHWFTNYTRMTFSNFKELFLMVAPLIEKQTIVQIPMSPEFRLILTLRYTNLFLFITFKILLKYNLRYLATGESQKNLSIYYKCSPSSVHNIVSETTNAIYSVFHEKVFPKLSQDYFQTVAEGFENRWNFPHCIGAIDGKHINIQVNN